MLLILFLFFTYTKSIELKYTYTSEEFLYSHNHTNIDFYKNLTNNTHTQLNINTHINETFLKSPDYLYDSLYYNKTNDYTYINSFKNKSENLSKNNISSSLNILKLNISKKSNYSSNNSIIKKINKIIIFLSLLGFRIIN